MQCQPHENPCQKKKFELLILKKNKNESNKSI